MNCQLEFSAGKSDFLRRWRLVGGAAIVASRG